MLADASETNRTASILIGSILALSLVIFAVLLFRHANGLRVAAEALIAEEIAHENRTYCGNFGMGPQTARHAECAKGLMEIRKRHHERTMRDMIGVL
jgi:hypothetical protein